MTTTIGNNNDDSNKDKVNGQNEDIESGRKPESDSSIGVKASSKEPAATRVTRNRPLRVWLRRVAVMLIVGGILAALAAVVYIYLGWLSLVQIVIVAIVAWLASGKYRWFIVAAKTAPRDVRALYGFIRLLLQIRGYSKKNMILADIFQQNVRKHPNKICILYENEKWTFQQIEDYSNKIANVFKSHGYKRGDVVALYMENKPEYIATWIGLSKLGVIVPLINTNLRQSSLVHSITIAKSQAVVFGSELTTGIDEILEKIESKVALYHAQFGIAASTIDERYKNLNELLKEASPTPPVLNEKVNYHDHLVYIYTSGTTGLPKAAVISNSRYIFIVAAIHWLARFSPSDRFYVPLPLYHTAGGCMSVGQMLIFGSSLVVRKKFSASQYFPDCKKYECTVSQYIGEMARYVLAVPKSPADSDHKLRLIFGNGMRPQIWVEFVERFKIPRVAEFYGATEGNANIVNINNTVGAIGFVSRIIPQVYPISIIKVDPQTGEPIRNAKGLCQLCKPDEPGVFIGKIIPGNPSRAFLGYVDKEASKKKVVYDVFTKGDSAFLSGDILVADELGNLFFKDRTGDTFRWKGENVSTSEVEAVLSNIAAYKDVVVFGVEVRGQEGRAGMAAILDPEGSLDFKALADGIRKELPPYARPIFIRTLTKMDMTGTYKLKKNDLQDEAYDVNKVTDNVYYLDGSGQYKLVTKDIFDRINDGSIRL